MADIYTLEAEIRPVIGKKVKALRRMDQIPGVIYGVGGDPVHVMCQRRALDVVLRNAGGTHLINVVVAGTTHNTLVREVQRDTIKRTVLHVDFMRVDLTKRLRTEVPLTMVGTPKLAADWQLLQNIQTIVVECLPTNIPERVEVDINGLNTLGAQITVGSLPPIENVTFLGDPDEVIIRVAMLAAEPVEEIAPEAEAVLAEPEVVERGKKEEEEIEE